MKYAISASLIAMAVHSQAAISLTASSTTGVQTFAIQPAATEWSTTSIGTAASSYTSIAQVDAAAQTLAATAITAQLVPEAVPGTDAQGRYSGAGATGLIYTAPTGVNASFIMATLQNDSGSPASAITISYDYTRNGTAQAEEVMGHRVYYSLTGLANSWTAIPALSGVSTNQTLTSPVTLSSAWADGAKLYLLWADDNGSGSPDTAFTIDNFSVTAGIPNTPPAVSITSPATGAVATAPATVNLAATATDDGGVAQVEFLRNGSVIATDTTSPYSISDSGLAAGNHTYTARATDNLGATTISAAVAVNVFTNPANTALLLDGVDDCVTMGAAPALNAGGPPSNGFTLECWFRKEGAGITSSSGSGGVTAVPLFGKGRGEADNSPVDCNYFFGITTGGLLAADFEAYPAGGITAGQNYPVTATHTPIADNIWYHAAVTYDGATTTWKVYLDGVQVGTATAAANALPRYDSIQHFGIGTAFNSTGVREGAFAGRIDEVRVWSHARTAAEIAAAKNFEIATASGLIGRYGLNEGTGSTTANSLDPGVPAGALTNGPLWVDGAAFTPNTAPAVALTAPSAGATLPAPAAINLTATATDADGIGKVEFFNGAAKLGEDATEPYTFDWTAVPQGTYVLTAKATDNFGITSTSAAVNITVDPPDTIPPTVAITAPADNANFIAPASITITASAADSDGTVSKVEFFNGATKLGEDATAPYTFDWTNIPAGDYTLTARATDNLTAATTSSPVVIHVLPNQVPVITPVFPADLASVPAPATDLRVSLSDAENQPLAVTFYGRLKTAAPGPDFTLMTLPDTQFYSENLNNRLTQFTSQVNWIVSQRNALNIAFVAHMGDMVNTTVNDQEWINADGAMDVIEDPATTLLAHGIPWGGAPGNHDIQSGNTAKWNQYFGASRWAGRPYFQGNYSNSNTNNYQFFSASGMDFIIINLVYNSNSAGDAGVFAWADALLKANPSRRAVITSHWIVNTGNPATFGGHGQALYNELKDNPNLFLMLCGHVHGEGRRSDTFEGRTVYSVLQDYQGRSGAAGGFGGGDGWLRYFVFSPLNNAIHAKTYRTTSGEFETDADSQFTLPYNMTSPAPWTGLGTVNVPGGGNSANIAWTGLVVGTEYEWYAAASDGVTPVSTGVRSFTAVTPPTVTITATDAAAGEFGADQALAFSVTRTGPTAGALTVPLTASGSAMAADYSGFTNSVVIPAAQSSVTIALTVSADGEAEGMETVSLTLGSSANFIAGSPASATANIIDSPAQDFYFTRISDPAKRGPDQHADDDGVPNLLEFAFGLNPTVNDSGPIIVDVPGGTLTTRGLPALWYQSTGNGTDFSVLFIRRKDAGAAGLTYTPQFSGDLSHWENSAVIPTVVADSGEVEAVSVPYPLIAAGKEARYFRLEVTNNP